MNRYFLCINQEGFKTTKKGVVYKITPSKMEKLNQLMGKEEWILFWEYFREIEYSDLIEELYG